MGKAERAHHFFPSLMGTLRFAHPTGLRGSHQHSLKLKKLHSLLELHRP